MFTVIVKFLNNILMSSLFSTFSGLNVKKMPLTFAPTQLNRMKVWTFSVFESDSIACKNSFNSSFPKLQINFPGQIWMISVQTIYQL